MARRMSIYLYRTIPAVMILLALYALPLAFIFMRAFENGAEALISVFSDPYTYKLLAFSSGQALLSALISIALALPFSAFLSSYKFPGRKMLLTLASLSFTMPAILVVLGFVIWYGNNGVLNSLLKDLLGLDNPVRFLYSYSAIILAHVYLNFPVALSLITGAWSSQSDREEKASYLMGKGRVKTFFSITLKKIRGTLISAFSLIFLFCFSSFTIILVLGGKPEFYTLEAEIYKRTYTDLAPSSSAALSIFVFLITSIFLLIFSGGGSEKKMPRIQRELKKAKGINLLKAFIVILLILLFILPPILAILYRAFYTKDGTFTLKAWKAIAKGGVGLEGASLKAIINSLIIALSAAIAATALAESIALYSAKRNSKLLPLLATLPMATGSVTLGLGFSFFASNIRTSDIYISYLLVFLAHLVIALPFAVRTITPRARKIPANLVAASYTLGSSNSRTLRKIERPLLRPYKRKAFAFAFALSLGEVNATLTLSEGRVVTLPVLLYRMIGSYNYQGAAALGTILLLEALIFFAIGEKGSDDGLS